MDKYNELLLNKIDVSNCFISVEGTDKNYNAIINLDDKRITIKQDEDINLKKYQFIFVDDDNKSGIRNISYYLNNKWNNSILIAKDNISNLLSTNFYKKYLDGKNKLYLINIDFDKKIKKIRIEYKNNIIDPVELEIDYIETSREAYNKRIEEQNRAILLEKMSVICRTGNSLVNVYWNIVNKDVKKVVLELYIDNKQLISKEVMSSDVMFKSIQGLAYGTYYYKIYQFDEKDNLIISTNLNVFTIN